MSGGAYDYAYSKLGDLRDALDGRGPLEAIADALGEAGAEDAAGAVLDLLAIARAAERRFESASRSGLADVLKAFEWWKSADWSEERFREVLAAYREGKP